VSVGVAGPSRGTPEGVVRVDGEQLANTLRKRGPQRSDGLTESEQQGWSSTTLRQPTVQWRRPLHSCERCSRESMQPMQASCFLRERIGSCSDWKDERKAGRESNNARSAQAHTKHRALSTQRRYGCSGEMTGGNLRGWIGIGIDEHLPPATIRVAELMHRQGIQEFLSDGEHRDWKGVVQVGGGGCAIDCTHHTGW
jgi:hypothetical protein